MRSVVVLPQPLGPSIEKNSPSPISSDTSSTATAPPKRLLTFSSAIPTLGSAMVAASLLGGQRCALCRSDESRPGRAPRVGERDRRERGDSGDRECEGGASHEIGRAHV